MDYNPITTTNPLDFNAAEPQQEFDAIPHGTIAKVRLTIKRGGYNDLARGWTDDCATRNPATGAVYLNCQFVILEQTSLQQAGLEQTSLKHQYAGRKVWSLIGLHSPKGSEWSKMGNSFIRAILNSARGFAENDTSPEAIAARDIRSLAQLDGLEFFARIDVEANKEKGTEKNIIQVALTKGRKDYPGALSTQGELQAALSGHLPDAASSWAR